MLLWGHSCGTLLWDTLVTHPCLTLLLDTLVPHSGNTLSHYSETLLKDTLARHSCLTHLEHLAVQLCTTKRPHSTSQYYLILQILHRAIPSTTLYNKSCARHGSTTLHYKACTRQFSVLLPTPGSTLHTQLSTHHTPQSTLPTTPHSTLQNAFTLHTPHLTLHT